MPFDATTHETLGDRAAQVDDNGIARRIVNMQEQHAEMLMDMMVMEGNQTAGHKETIMTGLPTVTWRRLNTGVQPSKGRYSTVEFSTGQMQAYAEVDRELLRLHNFDPVWRANKEVGFLEAFAQDASETLIYGNEAVNPEKFTGLAAYYNDLSAESADNIIDAGGTSGELRSIYLVVFGPNSVYGIVPKGMPTGLEVRDLGEATAENVDGSNGMAQVFRSQYVQNLGLVVADWRQVVRIANIPKSLIVKDAATGPDIPDLLFQAMERIHNINNGRAAFYMPRDIRTAIRQQCAYATQNSTLEIKNVGGVQTYEFQGLPLRRVDKMAVTETRVQ